MFKGGQGRKEKETKEREMESLIGKRKEGQTLQNMLVTNQTLKWAAIKLKSIITELRNLPKEEENKNQVNLKSQQT